MKTVIEMAREAGDVLNKEWLERFTELVRADAIADEREECAQIADQMTNHSYLGSVGQAIRARSKNEDRN